MDGRERRQYPRLEGHFKVDLLNLGDDPSIPIAEAVVDGQALDVSKHGLRLQSRYNVPIGAMMSVVVYEGAHESVCICEVVWKRGEPGAFLYGLFIREWSQIDRALARKLEVLDVPSAIPLAA